MDVGKGILVEQKRYTTVLCLKMIDSHCNLSHTKVSQSYVILLCLGLKVKRTYFKRKMRTQDITLTLKRALNFQCGLMVVTCYLSPIKDDNANTLCLTRACSANVFPTGVIGSDSKRLKTFALSAGLPSSIPRNHSQTLSVGIGAGNMDEDQVYALRQASTSHASFMQHLGILLK